MDAFATSTGIVMRLSLWVVKRTVTDSGDTKYNLFKVTSTTVETGDSSDSATPSEVNSGVLTKSCQ